MRSPCPDYSDGQNRRSQNARPTPIENEAPGFRIRRTNCRSHIPVQTRRSFEAQGSIFDGRSQTMKVLAISQTRCASAHMSLDGQAACGIELPVQISVVMIISVPVGP